MHRLNFFKQHLNQIKMQKTARHCEEIKEQHGNKKNTRIKMKEDT